MTSPGITGDLLPLPQGFWAAHAGDVVLSKRHFLLLLRPTPGACGAACTLPGLSISPFGFSSKGLFDFFKVTRPNSRYKYRH